MTSLENLDPLSGTDGRSVQVGSEVLLMEAGTRDAVHTLAGGGSVPACERGIDSILTAFHDLVAVEPDSGAVSVSVADGELAASVEGVADVLGDFSHGAVSLL